MLSCDGYDALCARHLDARGHLYARPTLLQHIYRVFLRAGKRPVWVWPLPHRWRIPSFTRLCLGFGSLGSSPCQHAASGHWPPQCGAHTAHHRPAVPESMLRGEHLKIITAPLTANPRAL